MVTVTRHVLGNSDRRQLEAFLLSQAGEYAQEIDTIPPVSPSPTQRSVLIQAAVDAGWPRAAAIEAYDNLLMKGGLHEFREVAA